MSGGNTPGEALPDGIRDRFGLLPVEFRPGLLKRLLGARGFTLRPDHLVIARQPQEERIPYQAITAVCAAGSSVALSHGPAESSRSTRLEAGHAGEAAELAALLRRLAEESRRQAEILRLPPAVVGLGTLIDECLGFRGGPYVAAAEALLRHAAGARATDLHLEPLGGTVRVTARVARGEPVEAGTYRHAGHEGLCSRLKYLAGCHSHRTGIAQEGSFSLPDGAGEVRLSVYPAADGERVALRIIRPIEFPDLPSLGWASGTVEAWRSLLADGPGLALIVGPIGSGKTTALYATLAELARGGPGAGAGAGAGAGERRRVATLEDPIEGRVPGICQSSLAPEFGSSLEAAFKHLLRQDPDLMALGEIRDAACLREALQAGQAGHLVLATFHAADAAGALERLRQLGLEAGLVATSLKGILAVRLEKGLKPAAVVWRPGRASR